MIFGLIYVLFIGLQVTYLFSAFTGNIPQDFTYAEYARRGFFELCYISLCNLGILWSAGAFSKTERGEHKGISLLTVFLSISHSFSCCYCSQQACNVYKRIWTDGEPYYSDDVFDLD